MPDARLKITCIGGPTALLGPGGLRMPTDPTFDPAGEEYQTSLYTLRKLMNPVVGAGALGHVDVVLLSHDQHFDNLDRSGRALLKSAGKVLTTEAGAERIGGRSPVRPSSLCITKGWRTSQSRAGRSKTPSLPRD